ncbi:MAG: hypothetical protein SCM11_06575 [Bacillota bacterium]|nr:hypothetical protein [Bacillota bacterium]
MMRKYYGLILMIIIALLVAGCSAGDDQTTTTKTTTASTAAATTTTKADNQTTTKADSSETIASAKYVLNGVAYETGEKLPWPAEYLPDVPQLNANIVMTAYDQKTKVLVISYEDVKTEDVKAYAKTLKEKGFAASLEMEVDGGYTFTGEHKDGQTILVMHADDQTGVMTYDPDKND